MVEVSVGDVSDAGDVFEIARSVGRGWDATGTRGFLISAYSAERYRELLATGALLVARSGGVVVGFATAWVWGSAPMAPTRTLLSSGAETEIELGALEDSIWIDQIAVAPSHMRGGVACGLYEALFQRYPRHSFLSAVVERPYANDASVAFHVSRGFRRIGTFRAEEYCGLSPYQSGIFLRRS